MKRLPYDWGDLNVLLFKAINGHSWHGADWLMIVPSYVADIWSFPLYAGLWWWWLGLSKRRGAEAAAAIALQLQRFIFAFIVAVLAAALVKYSLNFPRPLSALGAPAVHVLGEFDSEHSLPSGHAMFAMLVAGSLWPLLSTPGRAAAVAFVAWAGIARIWVGAHFPADVAAGYVLGFIWVGFAALALRRATSA